MPPSRGWLGRPARGLALGLLLALGLIASGCGSSPSTSEAVSALRSGVPVHQGARALDTALVTSTPDDGFYVDPTYLHVYYLRQVKLEDVIPLLSGTERNDAAKLEGLGTVLEVVVLATNPGESTTGVDLTQSVLESSHTADLVPSGVHTAVQRTYYSPIRPIVVLSSYRLDVCSADVNPGAQVWMMAVFPPIRLKGRLALVDPEFVKPAIHGFYVPLDKGAVPSAIPATLYSQDVDHCIQILNES